MTDVEIAEDVEKRQSTWLATETVNQELAVNTGGKHLQRSVVTRTHSIDGQNVRLLRRVHEYVGPSGPGWMVKLHATIGADVWCRTLDQGPGSFEAPWVKRKPIPA